MNVIYRTYRKTEEERVLANSQKPREGGGSRVNNMPEECSSEGVTALVASSHTQEMPLCPGHTHSKDGLNVKGLSTNSNR